MGKSFLIQVEACQPNFVWDLKNWTAEYEMKIFPITNSIEIYFSCRRSAKISPEYRLLRKENLKNP